LASTGGGCYFLSRCCIVCGYHLALQLLDAPINRCTRWSWRTNVYLHPTPRRSFTSYRNKWVLNETSAPLFFLLVQLLIAVILFLASDALRLLPDRLSFDINVCKGLGPMVGLGVTGLACVPRVPSQLVSYATQSNIISTFQVQ
jgi:hypothetical protein